MTNHPLTNEICERISRRGVSVTTSIERDNMRAATDWQLEQDQKELKYFLEEFSCRGHSADAVLDLRAFVNNFQSIMRPTQEDS